MFPSVIDKVCLRVLLRCIRLWRKETIKIRFRYPALTARVHFHEILDRRATLPFERRLPELLKQCYYNSSGSQRYYNRLRWRRNLLLAFLWTYPNDGGPSFLYL